MNGRWIPIALALVVVLAVGPTAAGAGPGVPPEVAATPAVGLDDPDPVPCQDGEVPLFAGGGTNLSNGFFFPGTAVYDGEEFQGEPYVIEKGCNLHFYNFDIAAVTNGHRIMSFKRKKRKPLFSSPLVKGPDDALVITEHVKPGVYPYFCTVHANMYGLLQVAKP